MTRRGSWGGLAGLAGLAASVAVLALLAGCTGVPSSSAPEVITSVGAQQPSQALAITPAPGSPARTIVSDFLAASATGESVTEAQGFLTPARVQLWSASTVTVLDSTQVSSLIDGSITVSGHKLGAIDASGKYTPAATGDGAGSLTSFTFAMKQVRGQWRIDNLQNGLIVDDNDFQLLYQQRPLYFFDLADKHVVADPRYTAISDPALLASWLISQLAAGPGSELQTAVGVDFPAQTDPSGVAVVVGTTTQVQVRGAALLDPGTRNRLAAQIALTLQPVAIPPDISIVDQGRPVTIPQVGGTTFEAANFAAAQVTTSLSPDVYYLNNSGHILTEAGAALNGRANGQYDLTSVAIADTGSPDLRIAGVAGPKTKERLYIGTQNLGLSPTSVPSGELSRPAWAPELGEAWVGDGTAVYRVPNGGAPVLVPLAGTGAVSGQVIALRFSPEGTRIAMVIAGEGTSQIWIGAVVRAANNGPVSVDSLEQISPPLVAITDVAWNGPLKLFAIGKDLATGEAGVDEVQVDGSLWTPRGISNLPGDPDSITIAENEVAWVSTGQTVWEQQAESWVSPHGGTTEGSDPVYVE